MEVGEGVKWKEMGWNGIGGNYENKTGSECVFEDIWIMG